MAEFEVSLSELIADGNLPDVAMYQYYKCLSENIILINQEISDDIIEYALLPYERMDRDPNVDEITILINSIGGAIRPALSFIDSIERAQTKTKIRIVGDADSMATLIVMAKGEHVHKVCDKWCVGLLHAGNQSAAGDTNAVNDQIKFNQQFEKKIEEFILSHSKIDRKLYNKMKRMEYWMDAPEMLRLGIVDEII